MNTNSESFDYFIQRPLKYQNFINKLRKQYS